MARALDRNAFAVTDLHGAVDARKAVITRWLDDMSASWFGRRPAVKQYSFGAARGNAQVRWRISEQMALFRNTG